MSVTRVQCHDQKTGLQVTLRTRIKTCCHELKKAIQHAELRKRRRLVNAKYTQPVQVGPSCATGYVIPESHLAALFPGMSAQGRQCLLLQ